MESNYLMWSLILISLVLSGMSLASNDWSSSDATPIVHQTLGLWEECAKPGNSDYKCVNNRDNSGLSDSARRKVLYLRSGATAATVLILLALFADVFSGSHPELRAVSIVLLLLAVAVSVVVMIMWATDKTLGRVRAANQKLAAGWYLQLASSVFALIALVLLFRHDSSYGF